MDRTPCLRMCIGRTSLMSVFCLSLLTIKIRFGFVFKFCTDMTTCIAVVLIEVEYTMDIRVVIASPGHRHGHYIGCLLGIVDVVHQIPQVRLMITNPYPRFFWVHIINYIGWCEDWECILSDQTNVIFSVSVLVGVLPVWGFVHGHSTMITTLFSVEWKIFRFPVACKLGNLYRTIYQSSCNRRRRWMSSLLLALPVQTLKLPKVAMVQSQPKESVVASLIFRDFYHSFIQVIFQLLIGKIAIEKHLHFLDVGLLTSWLSGFLFVFLPCHLFFWMFWSRLAVWWNTYGWFFRATPVVGHQLTYSLYSFVILPFGLAILSYYRMGLDASIHPILSWQVHHLSLACNMESLIY